MVCVEDYGHFKTQKDTNSEGFYSEGIYDTKMNIQRLNFVIKKAFRYFCTVLKNMIIIFSVAAILINMSHYLVIIYSSV